MIRSLACVIAAAFPAHAQDAATWGGTGCHLVPVTDAAYVAEVRCRNVVTSGESFTEGVMISGALMVHLAVMHGEGSIPDVFTITPPDGYVAEPHILSLNENARGVVFIYPWVGM